MERKSDGSKKSNKKLYIIIGVVAFFVLVGIMGNDSDNKSGKMTAYWASQEFVNKNLKAPSTATFPGFSEAVVADLGGGRFRVSAYVDAQNSFGAQIRTQYTCVVRGRDESNWNLESIDM